MFQRLKIRRHSQLSDSMWCACHANEQWTPLPSLNIVVNWNKGTSPDNNAVSSISPHTIDSACLLKLLEKKKTNKQKPSFLAFLIPSSIYGLRKLKDMCPEYNSILRRGPEPSSDEIHLWGMGDSPLGPEFLLCWTCKVSSEKMRQVLAVGLSGQLLCFILCLQPDLIRKNLLKSSWPLSE